MAASKRYTQAEKSEAVIASKELGVAVAAERLGVTTRSIEKWRADLRNEVAEAQKESSALPAVPDSLTYRERQPLLANRYGYLAQSMLEEVPALLAAGRYQAVQQVTTSSAICVDKAQLLSGNATSRTEHGSTPAELDARLLELAATLRAQRDNLREGRAVEAASVEGAIPEG